MRAVAVLLALLAAGCASVEPVAPRVTIVEKPIPLPCVERLPPKPVFALGRLSTSELEAMSDYELVLSLWIERAERIAYEAELEAMLAGCTTSPER